MLKVLSVGSSASATLILVFTLEKLFSQSEEVIR